MPLPHFFKKADEERFGFHRQRTQSEATCYELGLQGFDDCEVSFSSRMRDDHEPNSLENLHLYFATRVDTPRWLLVAALVDKVFELASIDVGHKRRPGTPDTLTPLSIRCRMVSHDAAIAAGHSIVSLQHSQNDNRYPYNEQTTVLGPDVGK